MDNIKTQARPKKVPAPLILAYPVECPECGEVFRVWLGTPPPYNECWLACYKCGVGLKVSLAGEQVTTESLESEEK